MENKLEVGTVVYLKNEGNGLVKREKGSKTIILHRSIQETEEGYFKVTFIDEREKCIIIRAERDEPTLKDAVKPKKSTRKQKITN